MEIILKYFPGLSEMQIKQFGMLEQLFRDWNNKINVISRKDIDHLYERHVLHSLSIAAVYSFPPATSIIDIGTGGGFPGIPLAIYFPDSQFLLVDSISKKLKVVEEIANAAGLKNIITQHTRVEEIRKPAKFDYAVSRAVAPLKEIWSWSKPLLKQHIKIEMNDASRSGKPAIPGPGLFCLKGGDLSAELKESKTHPQITPINDLFTEPFFEEKSILYIPYG